MQGNFIRELYTSSMVKTMEEEEKRSSASLYRKYRPGVFDEVRGQEHIVSVLRAAVEHDTLAHAYLFAGGRGTGKTSTARILAKAVGTSDQDLYEMDAASNRGIDEIRELRDGVATLPFESKYKFYIIDEAHALTPQAWGALLKTLEEPPSHVVFVLATTELDRVPETIISRCQTFVFKKPSSEILKSLVMDVAKKEKVTIEPAAAELLALMGDGSYRDTLGILQKVLTVSTDSQLNEAEVALVVGAPQASVVNTFLACIASKDIEGALSTFHTALKAGIEARVFVLLTVTKVRSILLLRFAPTLQKEMHSQYSSTDLEFLQKMSGKEGASIHSKLLAELITTLLETSRAPEPAIPLELALYRIFSE